MNYRIVANCQNQTGESPVWSVAEQALYWVDIPQGQIFRWHAAQGVSHWQTEQVAACIMPHISGDWMVCQQDQINRISLVTEAKVQIQQQLQVSHPHPDLRFNDGTCDRQGRIWVGSMHLDNNGSPVGSLYCYSAEGLSLKLSGLCTPNGLAFSPDGRTLYLSDSHKSVQKIWAFDYDPDTATISQQRLFVNMQHYDGRPDGATVDTEGCYWCCAIDSGKILRFDPQGQLVQSFDLPVSKPTKCIFGGANLDTLFVTSLRPDAANSEQDALSGAVFALDVGVRGLAETAVNF